MKKALLFLLACLFANPFVFAQTLVKTQPAKINIAPASPSDSTGNLNDYGGKMGIGIAIFGGIGFPVRFYVTPKHVAEAGAYLSTVVLVDSDDQIDFSSALMLGAGYTYFGNRFETKYRKKIRANGVALRFNQLTGDYQTTFLSVGWAMETIRPAHPNRSFIFELGLRQSFPNYVYEGRQAKPTPGLYLRCHWNFFL